MHVSTTGFESYFKLKHLVILDNHVHILAMVGFYIILMLIVSIVVVIHKKQTKRNHHQLPTLNNIHTKETFYRRKLPSPPAVSFSSEEGKQIFRESLQSGHMEGYFILAEQFRTQDEPAFCGISTLVMVLNTLGIDPKRIWKRPWRWYSEYMLDCCHNVDIDKIKIQGIQFDEFVCIGRCNSLNMIVKRPNQRHIYPTEDSKHPIIQHQSNNASDSQQKYFTVNEFRDDVIKSCISCKDPIIIVSYSRKGLQQTGDGHFSPIAGYHKEKDMVLIMDVARFKYPPHWVKIETLYHAMCRIDETCNKTRGWILASCPPQTTKPYQCINM